MKPPAFQFYADDFVAGVADMTQAEVGAYILLLCRQWCAGEIPQDTTRLEMVAKGKVSKHVLAKFKDGKNRRLEIVREGLEAFKKRQSQAGKLGMEHRWNKGADKVVITPLCSGYNQNITLQSPSPSPISTTKLPTKAPSKLLEPEWMLANRCESILQKQWTNDAGKWIGRIKRRYDKTVRVFNEVESAIKESRINTSPAQYAEQIWKEFK
jgi:hypothetical protein